jgi:PleD family two-component response regulator
MYYISNESSRHSPGGCVSLGRILIVDDQPKIRRFMRTTLVADGYEVDEAKTGEDALARIREFRPDLAYEHARDGWAGHVQSNSQ